MTVVARERRVADEPIGREALYFFDLAAPSTSLTLRAAPGEDTVSARERGGIAWNAVRTRRERLAELLSLVRVGKAEGVPASKHRAKSASLHHRGNRLADKSRERTGNASSEA